MKSRETEESWGQMQGTKEVGKMGEEEYSISAFHIFDNRLHVLAA